MADIENVAEYMLYINNIKYKVEICIIKENENKKILFTINEVNSFPNYYYTSDFSLDEIKNMNKNFRKFDTIDEAFEELNALFSNKKATLQIESNAIFIHFIIQNLSASKTEDIYFKIIKKILIMKQ